MIWIVAVLVLAYTGTVGGFLVYLKGLNQRTDRERQRLLDRIQVPEMTAAASVVENHETDEKQYVSVMDDDEFQAELERLEQ